MPIERIADANPLAQGSNANSVESAAAEFDRLFEDTEPETVNPTPQRQAPRSRSSEPAEAPDADQDDDEDSQAPDGQIEGDPILDGEIDTADEDEEADEEAEEGEEDEDEDADEDEDEIDLDREVEVTVNGQAQRVKLSEALAGYSRDADYRQKTAKLAEERREVEEYAQEVVQERQQYAETLQTWVDMTEALKPSQAEWDALERTDPKTFIAVQKQWSEIDKKVEEAKAEQTKLVERQAQEEARRYRQYVEEENQRLYERVPQLANPKKANEFRSLILNYGKAAGYSEQELMQGAVDHRDVLTLYKAARYDEIVKSRKTGQRPGKKAPKQATSSQPRSIGRPGASEKTRRAAERRLAQSGSVEDAATAFTAMLTAR